MTERKPTPAGAVLVADDISKHRYDVLIAERGRRRRRRLVVLNTREDHDRFVEKLSVSERRSCMIVGVARSTQQYRPTPQDDDKLRLALIRLAKQYG